MDPTPLSPITRTITTPPIPIQRGNNNSNSNIYSNVRHQHEYLYHARHCPAYHPSHGVPSPTSPRHSPSRGDGNVHHLNGGYIDESSTLESTCIITPNLSQVYLPANSTSSVKRDVQDEIIGGAVEARGRSTSRKEINRYPSLPSPTDYSHSVPSTSSSTHTISSRFDSHSGESSRVSSIAMSPEPVFEGDIGCGGDGAQEDDGMIELEGRLLDLLGDARESGLDVGLTGHTDVGRKRVRSISWAGAGSFGAGDDMGTRRNQSVVRFSSAPITSMLAEEAEEREKKGEGLVRVFEVELRREDEGGSSRDLSRITSRGTDEEEAEDEGEQSGPIGAAEVKLVTSLITPISTRRRARSASLATGPMIKDHYAHQNHHIHSLHNRISAVQQHKRSGHTLELYDRYEAYDPVEIEAQHQHRIAACQSRTGTRSRSVKPHIPIARTPPFDVYTVGISDVLHFLQTDRLSSVEICETYLRQIEEHNGFLRALTWVMDRGMVRRLAEKCDRERAEGRVDWGKKRLHGVPIIVKENMATDEELGMPTTAGSFALLGMPVKKDAYIVRKLREAGAIIIGKANMSELADYKSKHAGAGWSAVGGQTINVYAPHASPGTSSAGNGVSAAAGFAPASIGTETDGSITLPCLQSCLYGLKPTVGLLSRAGIVPFAPHFDTPGPMAKDVMSLAILLDVMQGKDVEDMRTLDIQRIPRGFSYIDSCERPTFEGLRIGVPRLNWHEIDPWQRPGRDELVPEISNAFEMAIKTMSKLGAVITDPADIPSAVDNSLWECAAGSRSLVVAADCNHYLTEYLQNLGGEGGCRSVADVIAFNEKHADIEMPPGHHGQEVLMRCLTAVSVDSAEYAAAKEDMLEVAGRRGLDAVMDKYNLDALFMIREGHHSPANMVGYPIGAVPIGLLCDNTPYGAFFIGRKHGERTLLRILAAWEAALGKRPTPPIAHAWA